jgi:hypothetical protein
MKSKVRAAAIKNGYRSGLEDTISKQLKDQGVPFEYETLKIKWEDHMLRTYTPDFQLPNGIIIETKGRFVATDRRKHLEIKKQFPNHDIRFVFSNANNKIAKGSKTSYSKWCDQKGFLWANKTIPKEWIDE